jgi:hypothetical protein
MNITGPNAIAIAIAMSSAWYLDDGARPGQQLGAIVRTMETNAQPRFQKGDECNGWKRVVRAESQGIG